MAERGRPTETPRRVRARANGAAAREAHKIRYSVAEWAIVVERARACGRPPARYVRETSLGAVPKADRRQPHTVIIHELGRAGTAVMQLAAVARSTGALPAASALEGAVSHLLAVARMIDQPTIRRRKAP